MPLDPTVLLDTQEVAGSIPARPTTPGPARSGRFSCVPGGSGGSARYRDPCHLPRTCPRPSLIGPGRTAGDRCGRSRRNPCLDRLRRRPPVPRTMRTATRGGGPGRTAPADCTPIHRRSQRRLAAPALGHRPCRCLPGLHRPPPPGTPARPPDRVPEPLHTPRLARLPADILAWCGLDPEELVRVAPPAEAQAAKLRPAQVGTHGVATPADRPVRRPGPRPPTGWSCETSMCTIK